MTETFNPNQWTYHYIINDRTRTIEVPAGMKKAKITIKRNGKYEHSRVSVFTNN